MVLVPLAVALDPLVALVELDFVAFAVTLLVVLLVAFDFVALPVVLVVMFDLEGVTVVELVVLLVTVALPVVLTDELLEVLLATTAGIGIGKGAHLHYLSGNVYGVETLLQSEHKQLTFVLLAVELSGWHLQF